MSRFPSRFRRLDDILADLPIDDPMPLTELDGYLTAIAVCPDPIAPTEWLPPIWGGDHGEVAPFEDPIDVRLFADMVIARHAEIIRDLGRGKLQPIFDVDERNGDVLWEEWIAGFAMAMTLRPDAWQADSDEAVAALRTLVEIASDESALTSMEINAICDDASVLIPVHVEQVFAAHRREDASAAPDRPAKIGRNDPCPCGSGKKHKRCCAMA